MGGLFGFLTFGLGASVGQQIIHFVNTGELPNPRDAVKEGVRLWQTFGEAVELAEEELAEYDAMIDEENARLQHYAAIDETPTKIRIARG